MNLANNKPVIEYCGGTEIGGAYLTGSVMQKAIAGTFSTPALGSAFVVLNENGQPTDKGEVFLIPPSIGLSKTLLNKDHYENYYADCPSLQGKILRRHGDQIEVLPDGYFKAHGRVDDAMNLGGIKASSIQIEELINQIQGVAESAAIAVPPSGGGPSLLVIYYTVKAAEPIADDLLTEMRKVIRTELNPLFKVHECRLIESLPRTASNKVMRRKLRDLYLGEA
jgi:acetyl-CoA synthetase